MGGEQKEALVSVQGDFWTVNILEWCTPRGFDFDYSVVHSDLKDFDFVDEGLKPH